jgi:hypothetical protein
MTWQQVAARHGYASANSAANVCRGRAARRGMEAGVLNRYWTSSRARAALQRRLTGISWSLIAAWFGYANERSARAAVLCACADDDERERARTAWVRPLSTRRRDNGNGYIVVAVDPAHPLAGGRNVVLEHRLVLFEALGLGPLPCFGCGRPVPWAELEVHHRDHDRANNAPENLEPACDECNSREAVAYWLAHEEEEFPF